MKRTVLVTGAAGLIGSEVTRRLLDLEYYVVAIDNFSIGNQCIEAPMICWEKIDLTDPRLETILESHPIDSIIHCAAHPGGLSLMEPVLNAEVNVLASLRLFLWAAKNNIKVVYLSSSAVYGSGRNRLLKEDDILEPSTIYAVSKVACENYLKVLGLNSGLDWTILRLFATYGSGHTANTFQGIVNVLLTQLIYQESVIIKGSLDRIRTLVYVKDAATAILQALESQECRREIINIAYPESVTVGELFNLLKLLLNRHDVIAEVIEGTPGDPHTNCADCTKAIRLLGFSPCYDLRDGLSDLVRERTKH